MTHDSAKSGDLDDEVFNFLDRHFQALNAGLALPIPKDLLERHPELESLIECVEELDGLACSPDPSCVETQLSSETSHSSILSLPLPRNFGSFSLEEELGRGGMGVVYRARHLTLETDFALKMVRACEFATDEEIRRFFQEARAASRLRHPNIVSVYDAGEHEGIPFLVMTFVNGTTLTEQLKSRQRDVNFAVEVMLQVAPAVEYLHQQGIIHRDLKPSNILTDDSGTHFVADFGLAKVFGGEGDRTISGTILGTPAYMAPEQAWGRAQDICHQSDVYGLGAVMYEMLTGQPPFKEDTPLDQLLRLRDSEPRPVRKLNPDVPVQLETICMRCLEKKPEHRYHSANDFAEDLQRHLQGESIANQSIGLWTVFRRWTRREPALAVHLIALAIITLIVQVPEWVSPGRSETHLTVISTLAVWALLSIMFQRLISAGWSFMRRSWIAFDAAMFTIAVANGRGPFESLVAGYALMIVASSMWYKPRLVAVTTAATVLSYCVLLSVKGSEQTPTHYPFLVVGILIVTGGIVISLVNRILKLLSIRSRL